jgi:hypothetical protein
MQGQQHGSIGRRQRHGGISGSGKRSPRGRGGIRRWQQRGVGSSVGWQREKFAAEMQATLIPPPTQRLERERSISEHLTSTATEGTISPCALEGPSTPRGGEECLVVCPQWRSYSAGHFFPGVEAQLRLFVAPTPTHCCCCRIVSSGPTSTTTIYDDALVECMRQEGGQDNATTMTGTMTILLWGGGARCGAYSHVGVDSAAGRRCITSTDRQVLLGMI